MAFALVIAVRKLKPYFQAHTIIVLTDQPLKKAMSSPEAAGRMFLWAIKLSEFDVQYRPRTAVKGQIVADFIDILSQKTRGQKDSDYGASTRTDHQISSQEVPVWLYKYQRGIKSNA